MGRQLFALADVGQFKPTATPAVPTDEIDEVLALPAITAKVAQAERSIGQHSAPYVRRVVRYCYRAALARWKSPRAWALPT